MRLTDGTTTNAVNREDQMTKTIAVIAPADVLGVLDRMDALARERYQIATPSGAVLHSCVDGDAARDYLAGSGKGMQGVAADGDANAFMAQDFEIGETRTYRSRAYFQVGTAAGQPVVVRTVTRLPDAAE